MEAGRLVGLQLCQLNAPLSCADPETRQWLLNSYNVPAKENVDVTGFIQQIRIRIRPPFRGLQQTTTKQNAGRLAEDVGAGPDGGSNGIASAH